MADNPGIINSQIQRRDYTPQKWNSLMEFLKQGTEQGAQAARQQSQIEADKANLDTQGQQKMGQISAQGDQERQNTSAKALADQQTGDHAMQTSSKTMQDMYGTTNLADAQRKATAAGQSLHIGKDQVAVGQNELMKAQQAQNAQDMHAAQQAYGLYNKELPNLQKSASPILQGMRAVQDPTNVTKLGAAKAAMLRAYGLTRFNEAESSAQLSPSLKAEMAKWANYGGDDQSTLTDPQRRDVLGTLGAGLQDIKNNHDQIRQSALNTYQGLSPTGNRAAILQQNLGNNDFAKSLNDAIAVNQQAHDAAAKAVSNPNAGGIAKQAAQSAGGLVNWLTGGNQAPAPGASAQQAPARSGLSSLFGGTPPAVANQAAPTGKMKVKLNATGQTGTIDAHEFDPSIYSPAQ